MIDRPSRLATLSPCAGARAHCGMQIGDSVTYDGRRYVVDGFTPVSVLPAEIELRDSTADSPERSATAIYAEPQSPPADLAA
jgi:hypothetical protein